MRASAVVLICMADAAVRDKVAALMRSAGFAHILDCDGLDAAVGACSARAPDVVLFRPVGREQVDAALTARLRRLNADGNVSVIYLSTDDAPEARSALLAHGDDRLSLEHDLEQLPRRIQTHAFLRVLERMLRTERISMDERTNRLNKALDLLRDAEKRLESELSQAKSETRDRIDYFAETQHELRTPLNAICGMSDAMRSEMFGPIDNPKYKEYAENIFQSGQHLLAIIDGRLELSRIEVGAEPLDVTEVDLTSVIHETTEMLDRIAAKANVTLNVDIEDNLPVIETDRRKLRQVLVNLVSNAIKFTPEKGRVTVSVTRNARKGVLVLVISDTGIGMSANDARDAMKPYRRMSGDRRSGEKGSGLGLAIVRKLVETLGATIEIQTSPGKGTSIKVELPMSIPGDSQPIQAAG